MTNRQLPAKYFIPVFMSICFGCLRSEAEPFIAGVDFQLPDGFAGGFKVVHDVGGEDLILRSDGVVELVVPKSGIVRVNDCNGMFRRFYREITHFGGGSVPKVDSDFVAAHPVGVVSGKEGSEYWYFLGREDEIPTSGTQWRLGNGAD